MLFKVSVKLLDDVAVVFIQMTLQGYINDLFNTIFKTESAEHLFPFAIKYMFDFLDDQALHHGCHEPDIVHTWKSNR